MCRLKIAVFASGGGTNLQTIIDGSKTNIFDGEVAAIISNNSKSFALERARRAEIADYHISGFKYPDQVDFDEAIFNVMDKHSINLIVLAGYMKLLPEKLVERFKNRIINVHPALLPKYGGKGMYGMNVHEAVIKSGEKISGATVHFVNERFDEGNIIIQRTVPVLPDDSPDTLAARVLTVEHQVLPDAVSMFR